MKNNLREKVKLHLFPIALLLGCAFAIYGATFDHQFLVNWDDNAYVIDNETIRGFTLNHLKSAFTSFYVGNYAPLQIISYMFDHAVWGSRAGGFLLTNTLLHAAASVVFYFLLIRLHGRRIWALPAALLFLCHPLQVESVAWVSQRKSVLAMLFFLLSFFWYLLYQERRVGARKRWYAASLAAFLLAGLAKSVVVVLPAVLLMKNACFVQRTGQRRDYLDTLPFWGIAAGISLLAMISQDPANGGGRAGYWGGSLANTLLTMAPVLARYLRMIVWPTGLSAVYAQPVRDAVDLRVALSFLLIVALGGSAVYLYRKERKLCFWLAFFLICLVPVSQVVPLVTMMNDRYLYFPMLGVAGLFGGAVALLAERLHPLWRKAPLIVAGLLLLPLSLLSYSRVQVWKDAETLWRDAVKNEPGSSLAWLGLGHALTYRGYIDEALAALLRSHELFPNDEATLANLAHLYRQRNEPAAERRYLLKLLSVNPRHFDTLISLAENYLQADELTEAERFCRQAGKLRPGAAAVTKMLADIRARMIDPVRSK
jgi:tetratricopeptide (TPR) repeat protein